MGRRRPLYNTSSFKDRLYIFKNIRFGVILLEREFGILVYYFIDN
jgi:hypothetical protein